MTVIVGARRTPIGRLLGALRQYTSVELGTGAITAALESSGVPPTALDYAIMGQVIQAGAGQLPARAATVRAGVPMSVPAMTLNKVCLSGLDAVVVADQMIRAGAVKTVLAGGMESMTHAPHLLPRLRRGVKYGNTEVLDSLEHDGLLDSFENIVMGEATDRHTQQLGIPRTDQDEYALDSHQRAAAAAHGGVFAAELAEMELDHDEGVRPNTTLEKLAGLPAAFSQEGTITAGNASQLSDGAAALIVADEERARAEGWPILARIKGAASVAGPDNSLHAQPSGAILKLLDEQSVKISDLEMIEINEAFAAVVLHSSRQLGVDPQRVNVHGGAIALGHPVGMSGARLVAHLAHQLHAQGGLGVASLCGGGGQGEALLLEGVV